MSNRIQRSVPHEERDGVLSIWIERLLYGNEEASILVESRYSRLIAC